MKRLAIVLCFVFAPAFVSAQLVQQDVSVDITPSSPEPGDRISIVIESFAVSLDRSQISWVLDGAVAQKAVGDKDFGFTAGAIGTTHDLKIVIETPASGTITKEVTIRPASVDLLWEAIDSYVPPLYKGKALNAHDSGVRVAALPYFVDGAGRQINPESLIYTWTVNKKVQQSASGFGKNTFSFPGPSLYRDSLVTVDVESPDGSWTARRSLNLEAQPPKILFYQKNPLFGIALLRPFDSGITTLTEDEMVVRAEPYFFSDITNRQDVDYDWRIDGKEILTIGNRNEINVRRPEVGSGRSSISLEIKHIRKILQFARNSFTMFFDDREPSEQPSENLGDVNFFGN